MSSFEKLCTSKSSALVGTKEKIRWNLKLPARRLLFFYCTKSDQEICYHQVQHADSRFLILILMHIIFLGKKRNFYCFFFFSPDHSVVENRREKSTKASTKKLFLLSWCFEISFCETLQFSECVASFFF